MATKAVAKRASTAVAGYDYGADAGAGFEGTKQTDLAIPFIAILQPLSPQVADNDPAGSKPGMLFNTVTRELVGADDGLVFLPCHKQHVFVEWVPRDAGGGFVGMFEPEDKVVKDAIADNDGKPFGLTLGPNQLSETFYVYGLLLDEKGAESKGFAVVSFNSTKIKPYRDWITAMYMLKGRPPMFANRAVLRTVKQKNDKGTFYNFRIDPLHDTWAESLIDPAKGAGLLTEARDFREMIASGVAKAAFETERATGDAGGSEDGEAPF